MIWSASRYRLELGERVLDAAELVLQVRDGVLDPVLLDELQTLVEREVEADERGVDGGGLVDAEQLQVLEPQLRGDFQLRGRTFCVTGGYAG